MSLIHWNVKWVKGDPEVDARRLATEGGVEGIVLANRPRGSSTVSFSVVLRPAKSGTRELLPLIIAFCTSEGIRKDTGIITWLGWPDKVLVERKVVATTSAASGGNGRSEWVVLTSRTRTGPGAKRGDQCSLFDSLGVEVDPELLVEKILESLSWMYSGWTRQMDEHILARYRSMLDTIGRKIEISREGRLRVATARDVDDRGSLVLEAGGARESIKIEEAATLREL